MPGSRLTQPPSSTEDSLLRSGQRIEGVRVLPCGRQRRIPGRRFRPHADRDAMARRDSACIGKDRRGIGWCRSRSSQPALAVLDGRCWMPFPCWVLSARNVEAKVIMAAGE